MLLLQTEAVTAFEDHSVQYRVVVSVTGSPFAVPIIDGQLVNACGPGLQRAVAYRPATFTIDTCYVGGQAPMSVTILSK